MTSTDIVLHDDAPIEHGEIIPPPATDQPRFSQPLKRSDALQLVAATVAAFADAVRPVGLPAGEEWEPARIAYGGVVHALHELARSAGRTRGTRKVKITGPPTELDARGYKRAPATQPGAGKGIPPKSKGRRYPPDPPSAAEVFALMQACAQTPYGRRLRALIVVLWRSGLRISEGLALEERDLNPRTGSIVVRHGKGDKRRIVGMDPWGWQVLEVWMRERETYPRGPVFCVIDGPTAGRAWASTSVRHDLHKLAAAAGIRKRIAPHQLRHALAVDMVREGARLDLLQKQLGHANLGVTTNYLVSVTADEVVALSHDRRAPTVAVPDLIEALRVP